jgi:Rab5 GDP/GTP exchange factor
VDCFAKIDSYQPPGSKLESLFNGCTILTNLLGRLGQEQARAGTQVVVGADDFLPLLIFTLLKANPKHLWQNLEYIETFRSPSRMVGERQYFFTTFYSAVEFLATINKDNLRERLDISPQEFQSKYKAIWDDLRNAKRGGQSIAQHAPPPPPPPPPVANPEYFQNTNQPIIGLQSKDASGAPDASRELDSTGGPGAPVHHSIHSFEQQRTTMSNSNYTPHARMPSTSGAHSPESQWQRMGPENERTRRRLSGSASRQQQSNNNNSSPGNNNATTVQQQSNSTSGGLREYSMQLDEMAQKQLMSLTLRFSSVRDARALRVGDLDDLLREYKIMTKYIRHLQRATVADAYDDD